jgi:hypothetical protein
VSAAVLTRIEISSGMLMISEGHSGISFYRNVIEKAIIAGGDNEIMA